MNRKLTINLLLLFVSFQVHGQIDTLLSRIDFEMDYRFRAEQDWDSKKSDGTFRKDRSRLRYRLRTGATYTHNWYSFGFRIRTGNPNKQQDPQLTLGKGVEEFGTLPIGFERAYFQYKQNSIKFWLGKNTYPFSKNNELFWSDNVFTEGVFFEKSFQLTSSPINKVALSGGHFLLSSNNTSFTDDSYFQGFQATMTAFNHNLKIFPSLYIFKNIDNIPDGASTFSQDYTILHLGTKFQPLRTKKLSIDLDFYQNITSYADLSEIDSELRDQKTGYTIGVQLGDLKSKDEWLFKLTYAYLERYANLDYMAQNDWARWDYSSFNSPDGRLSNLKGLEAILAYSISNKINLVCKYYIVQQLVPYGIARETGQRIRFDIDIEL